VSKALIPLWGAALGAIGAVIYTQLSKVAPLRVSELVVAILWGALAFAPRENPKFGKTSVIILVAGIGIRWVALDAPVAPMIMWMGIASQTVARSSMITMAWASRPVSDSAAEKLGETLTIPVGLFAMAIGGVAAIYSLPQGLQIGLVIIAGTYLIVRTVQWAAYRYLGGVTGDSLGLTQLLTELLILLLFAWVARAMATIATKVVT
jgi:cobalamin synthase